jgi:competence protein ComEC
VWLGVVFFAGGAWLLQQQAELPSLTLACSLASAGALILMRGERAPVRAARRVLACMLCLAAGFFWAAAAAHWRMSDALPAEWEGRDIVLVGTVASLPQAYERSVRFEFDVESVLTEGAHVPLRVALAWWGSSARDGGAPVPSVVQAGERWQLTVRLRRPRGTANPHGFDYEAWLLEREIRATGYVRARGVNRRLASMVHRPGYWVEALRGALKERMQRALPDAPYAGVVVALGIGDQRAIPQDQWGTFTRTGVNHLMSISGLHVTMVSGLVFALAHWLWRRSTRLALRLPAQKAATLWGVAAAFAYTLLAGFAVPAQRTLYMLVAAAFFLWFGFTSSVRTILAAALLAVLLLDPWAVLAPGFWLSFGAVALILYVTVGRAGELHWLKSWLAVQWAVTVGLVPLLLALFQQVSLVSPLANAVAIPVVSLVVVPLTLLGMLLPFDFVLVAAHAVMAWCGTLLEWMSAVPAAVWQQHAPPGWSVPVAVAGVGWLLLPRGFPARWLGAILLAPLFLAPRAQLSEGELKLTVLDVGQGLAIVVQTREHALLYDTGPAFGPGSDSGNRIVVPFLRAAGISRVDTMILSHDDIDHTGGALSVLQALPVERLFTSLPDMDPLPLMAERAFRCFGGQNWEWNGIRFEMLHPARASYHDAGIRDNDRSCVMRITSNAGAVLVPADIERRSEAALLAEHGDALRVRVLIAPHQGSRTSSTPEFIASVKPDVVIFPVGYRNRFGHPHRDVVDRYRAIGSRVYRTDRDGAITFHFDASGTTQVEPYRATYRRYWHTRLEGDPVPDVEELPSTG